MPTVSSAAGTVTCTCGCEVERTGTLCITRDGVLQNVCFSCIHTNYLTCACGELVHRNEARRHNGQAYCHDCARYKFFRCLHDGNYYHVSEMLKDEHGQYIAKRYEDLYVICHESRQWVLRSNAVERDGKFYHPQHVPLRHRIRNYGYKPEPNFLGHGTKLRFGVELEIEGGGEDNRKCDELLSIVHPEGQVTAESIIYGKHDGSVDRGFEMVTHPATFEYHMKKLPWEELLTKARELGYRMVPSTCGLHIHMSREYWGDSEQEQDIGIMKLLLLVERFWDKLLVFSRRTEEQLDRWASRYGLRNTPQELLNVAKSGGLGRYKAVNLANQHTVEIRLFRGTLDHRIVRATIQLCKVLACISKKLSLSTVQSMSWSDFVKFCDRYEDLRWYLQDRGILRELTPEERRIQQDKVLAESIIQRVLAS
jgi:hypothetical protein